MNPMDQRWKDAILSSQATLTEVISNLNRVAIKIVLIVDQHGKLVGTISDGDIRRGLLKGLTLDCMAEEVVQLSPMIVPPGLSRDLVMKLMLANKIQQIPIVDETREIVGLHSWEDIMEPANKANPMIIMAGGKGIRLRPHTDNCPKPMLEVMGKPILQHIIERAKMEGFCKFVIAIHYLGHLIEEYFGDGKAWDVEIEYLRENEPLGTAGALSLLHPAPEVPLLVTNGDVLTDIHYAEILDFHLRHHASATMAVRTHEWQHPFGVVRTQGVDILSFEEKPITLTHINAGVYVLNPESLRYLVVGAYCDMPNLFERLQLASERTIAYPMHEPWLDVGRPDDLILANSGTP